MNVVSLTIVVSGIAFAIGITLFLVGYLVSMVTAFGNEHWFWGLSILFFVPIALLYCFAHSDLTAWPRGLLIKGVIALVIAIILFVAALS